jgi:hypothetical protein
MWIIKKDDDFLCYDKNDFIWLENPNLNNPLIVFTGEEIAKAFAEDQLEFEYSIGSLDIEQITEENKPKDFDIKNVRSTSLSEIMHHCYLACKDAGFKDQEIFTEFLEGATQIFAIELGNQLMTDNKIDEICNGLIRELVDVSNKYIREHFEK